MNLTSILGNKRRFILGLCLILGAISFCGSTTMVHAQDDSAADSAADRAAEDAANTQAESKKESQPKMGQGNTKAPALNLMSLARKGGWLMLPIVLMSITMIVVAIERGLAIRREKILPAELVLNLGELSSNQGGFDPKRAYSVCQQFPSVAANIIKSMLLKLGRPHSEVEHAVTEASQREASRLYSNVRILNLIATVTPLLGLLGTVWGMIQAFFATANLEQGANKADVLAEGIYVALVTTFFGLSVAIPAAILAHFFEGRIQSLFHTMEELLFNLLPQVERYEGKLRIDANQISKTTAPPSTEPPVVAATVGGSPSAVPK